MKTIQSILLFSFFIFSNHLLAQQIQLQTITTGFDRSIAVVTEPVTDYLYVVEQDGKIWLSTKTGVVIPLPFLDINLQVLGTNDNWPGYDGELGLLGMVFHPDFDLVNNPYFYVNYTNNPNGNNIQTIVSRFTVTENTSGDYFDVVPNSEMIILTYDQPFTNHNGGHLAFGPDGFLYIGTGDGGSGNDPGNEAQDPFSLLGKMLRIDIDTQSGGNNYAIPSGNAYTNAANGLPEIYSIGLRNPWRYCFDRLNGNLWIADVGQNEKEEVHFQAANMGSGLDYGWRCYEGSDVNNSVNQTGCPNFSDTEPPIFEYLHDEPDGGQSITGGCVYRGCNYPDLYGYYIFADYVSDNIWLTDQNFNTTLTNVSKGSISSFGEDTDGELYYVTLNGELGRLTEANAAATLSFVNLQSTVLTGSPINLNATPSGGVFSGSGVIFSAFNPAVSGSGTHEITYTYTNANGCESSISESILVGSIQYNFVNYNLGTINP